MRVVSESVSLVAVLEQVAAANQRLAAILGDPWPAWSPAVQAQAEQAVVGAIYQDPAGVWTRVNPDAVDWTAESTANPAHLIMVLRRFHMLRPLVAGWRATRDERYAQAARRYIVDFLLQHPPADDWVPVPGDGDTQYDIRVGVWLEALSELRDSAAFDAALLGQMLLALRGNLRYLTGHVRPDRNIRIWHGQVLLLSGLRLAAWPEAAAWLAQGRAIVNDAARRQILADGAHLEATPGYHGCVMDIIETLWRLAQALPELGLVVASERVAAMHDYQLATTRPDGVMDSLHDTRYEPATVAAPHTGVAAARAAFRQAAGLPATLPPTSQFFPQAGQAFVRDEWTPTAGYLSFDAAMRRSYHWQPSRNSLTLFAHGRHLLVDPGYTFESPEWPRYGHRTAHHNTINFNGWNQSQCPTPLRLTAAGDYTLVQGHYGGGYWPMPGMSHGAGIFGEHQRTVLWLRGRLALVLDHVQHTGTSGNKPTIESCWQLSEGPVQVDPAAWRAWTRHAHGNLLLLFPVVLPGSTLTVHEGEREPMRGWLPVEWGRRCVAAPQLRVVTPTYDPWHGDLATVLLPFAGAEPPPVSVTGTGPDAVNDARQAGCVTLTAADGSRDLFCWTRRLVHAIMDQHGLSTDAGLIHLRLSPAGEVLGGLLVDGSTCVYQGRDLLPLLTPMNRPNAP